MNESFESIDGKKKPLYQLSGKSGLVMVFISPECPLCQNYTRTMNLGHNEQKPNGINFLGVVSGTYITREEIAAFAKEYKTDFPIILDPEFVLSKSLNATITPEVIFFDSLSNVKYQGAIDNWAISLGQKRLNITAHYLNNALKNYLSGNEIAVPLTKPVGCYIE